MAREMCSLPATSLSASIAARLECMLAAGSIDYIETGDERPLLVLWVMRGLYYSLTVADYFVFTFCLKIVQSLLFYISLIMVWKRAQDRIAQNGVNLWR